MTKNRKAGYKKSRAKKLQPALTVNPRCKNIVQVPLRIVQACLHWQFAKLSYMCNTGCIGRNITCGPDTPTFLHIDPPQSTTIPPANANKKYYP
jgi:hypothetical protein